MLSHIFVGIEPLLRAKGYNLDVDEVIEFLGHYRSNQWIYPGVLHRRLRLDIKIVYEILEICVSEGLVEQYLEVYCPVCQRFTGQYFKTISEVPEEIYCSHCDEEITHPLKHAIIIYRVL